MSEKPYVVLRSHEELVFEQDIVGPFPTYEEARSWVAKDSMIVMGDLSWTVIPGPDDRLVLITPGFKKIWEVMKITNPEVAKMATISEWPNSAHLG